MPIIRIIKYLILFISVSTSVYGQSDSLNYKAIQKKLNGCWNTKYYQFKYDLEKNLGSEYKSPVHSSNPIFKLILKDHEICIKWIELMGGESIQKVIWIKQNKLKVRNEDSSKTTYRRNKACL